MIRTQLMPDFMRDIIDIEVISHRDRVSRRGNTSSFLSVYANTTNTAGISSTAGSAEHVTDIVVSLSNICS